MEKYVLLHPDRTSAKERKEEKKDGEKRKKKLRQISNAAK
jgi:hypothetical protein